MIRLQIIERHDTNLYKMLIEAMRSGKLRTFSVKKRGWRITHTNPQYPGWMNWAHENGVIVCEVLSPRKPGNEWKLLSAFIGCLADKYADCIHGISIQFPDCTVT